MKTAMEQGKGKFGVWVGLCCAVPLAALAAVLLFDAPTLPISLAAFAVLMLIGPRLLAVASGDVSKHARRGKPRPTNPTQHP